MSREARWTALRLEIAVMFGELDGRAGIEEALERERDRQRERRRERRGATGIVRGPRLPLEEQLPDLELAARCRFRAAAELGDQARSSGRGRPRLFTLEELREHKRVYMQAYFRRSEVKARRAARRREEAATISALRARRPAKEIPSVGRSSALAARYDRCSGRVGPGLARCANLGVEKLGGQRYCVGCAAEAQGWLRRRAAWGV